MRPKKRWIPMLLCIAVPLAGVDTCILAQSYTVFDVPGAVATYPAGMNAAGDITGYFCVSAIACPSGGFVRASHGTITTFDGIPTAINDEGTITGYLSNTAPRGFVRDRNGNITLFDIPRVYPEPTPYWGASVAINNQGEIAGYIVPCPICDTYVGFARDPQGNTVTFGNSDKGLMPAAINAEGEIAGHTSPYYPAGDGFVRTPDGAITMFDVPGASGPGPRAYAVAINDAGAVAGYYYDQSLGRVRSFVRDREGNITVFDAASNALSTMSAGINEQGDVAGNYSDTEGSHGFLRDRKGDVVAFNVPNAVAVHSVAINSLGDIAGYFYDATGIHGFVRTNPVSADSRPVLRRPRPAGRLAAPRP